MTFSQAPQGRFGYPQSPLQQPEQQIDYNDPRFQEAIQKFETLRSNILSNSWTETAKLKYQISSDYLATQGASIPETQRFLNQVNKLTGEARLNDDGKIGPQTFIQIALFQLRYGLEKVDGIIGEKTWGMMQAIRSNGVQTQTQTPEKLKWIGPDSHEERPFAPEIAPTGAGIDIAMFAHANSPEDIQNILRSLQYQHGQQTVPQDTIPQPQQVPDTPYLPPRAVTPKEEQRLPGYEQVPQTPQNSVEPIRGTASDILPGVTLETLEYPLGVEVIVSAAQAQSFVDSGRSMPTKRNGKRIIYKIDPTTVSGNWYQNGANNINRYKENSVPIYQEGSYNDALIRKRVLGPIDNPHANGKQYAVVHRTGTNPKPDTGTSKQSFNEMIGNGRFAYLILENDVVIQGADDYYTGGGVNTQHTDENVGHIYGNGINHHGIAVEIATHTYDRDPNSNQVKATHELLAHIGQKHNIPSSRFITSGDLLRKANGQWMNKVGIHKDDYKDPIAVAMGLLPQAQRLALIHSGKFVYHLDRPQLGYPDLPQGGIAHNQPPARPQPRPQPSVQVRPVQNPPRVERTNGYVTKISKVTGGVEAAVGHPLATDMLERVLLGEGHYGRRKEDGESGGETVYDIGGGLNTGAKGDLRYALGSKFNEYYYNFIPKTATGKKDLREAIRKMLEIRIAKTVRTCERKGVNFDSLPKSAQMVLVDLHYNMGNLNGWPNFWAAIKSGNYDTAAKELLTKSGDAPSSYLAQVLTRAYTNACMLSSGDTSMAGYKKFRSQGSGLYKRTNGRVDFTKSAYSLRNSFIQNHYGKYQRKINRPEQRQIIEESIGSPEQLLTRVLSIDALASESSTQTITRIVDTFNKENPHLQAELMQALERKFGDYYQFPQSSSEVGAYQIYTYLQDKARFRAQVKDIDGEMGPKTTGAFLDDCVTLYDIPDAAQLSQLTQQDIAQFSPFQKRILMHRFERSGLQVSRSSDTMQIRKYQVYLNLTGKNVSIDGVWSDSLAETGLDHEKNLSRAVKIINENLSFKSETMRSRLSQMKPALIFALADFAKAFPKGHKYNSGSNKIVITCTIRTRSENSSVGGAKYSKHLIGEAYDFRTIGKSSGAISAWRSHFQNAGLYVLRHTTSKSADHLHVGTDKGHWPKKYS